jgi:hypothetical protein
MTAKHKKQIPGKLKGKEDVVLPTEFIPDGTLEHPISLKPRVISHRTGSLIVGINKQVANLLGIKANTPCFQYADLESHCVVIIPRSLMEGGE